MTVVNEGFGGNSESENFDTRGFPVITEGPGVILLIPTGLDLHTEAGLYFSDFFPLPNPSGMSRNIMI
jgi:hypothetical protein